MTSAIGGCTAAVTGTAPTQPYASGTPDGAFAAAFVATSGCPAGKVGFAYIGASSAEVDTLDACSAGASLPAFAFLPGGQGAVAYYATPPMDDPLTGCAGAKPASLTLASIANVGQPSIGKESALTTSAVSVRPPAILWQSPVVFVASPDGAAASIWALDGQTLAVTKTFSPAARKRAGRPRSALIRTPTGRRGSRSSPSSDARHRRFTWRWWTTTRRRRRSLRWVTRRSRLRPAASRRRQQLLGAQRVTTGSRRGPRRGLGFWRGSWTTPRPQARRRSPLRVVASPGLRFRMRTPLSSPRWAPAARAARFTGSLSLRLGGGPS